MDQAYLALVSNSYSQREGASQTTLPLVSEPSNSVSAQGKPGSGNTGTWLCLGEP